MTLEYTTCPHCGCRCEDPEYCAACGKLFYQEIGCSRKMSPFDLLRSGLSSIVQCSRKRMAQNNEQERHCLDKGTELIEQDFCPTWSGLSSNVYNDDNK